MIWNHIRARRRRHTPSVTTTRGCGGMSSRGSGSWPALRSATGVQGAVPGGRRRGRDGSRAVGKPDKTPLCNVICGYFRAPGKVAWSAGSRLKTVLLRLNCRSIAKLLPNAVFAGQTKSCISKDLLGAAIQLLQLEPQSPCRCRLPTYPTIAATPSSDVKR